MRNGDWIQTFSGRQMYPLDPHPDEIHIEDIAHSLSNQCRWAGHTKQFYSVAQHSVMVSIIVPTAFALQGLMHDASEAYLVDVPRPIKSSLHGYHQAEEKVMGTIANRFKFKWPMSSEVETADLQLLCTEAHQLLKGGPRKDWSFNWKVHVQHFEIEPMSATLAEALFLERFKEVGK